MKLRQITDHAGEWLRGSGPNSEVVISSRVRLARNLAGFPFVGMASVAQRNDILERCRREVLSGRLGDDMLWMSMHDCAALDRELLVERHLISRQHAQDDEGFPRGVAVDSRETFSVMINEEDHLRIQVLRSGLQLSEAFDHVDHIDDVLEGRLDFAFSRKFGFLTACPTNVGTGIRVSVMLHLPALKLTGDIEKVRRAAHEMHLAVRGLYGEGSDAQGDLYQVSNQSTMGKSEQEILSDFEHTVVPQIIAYEQQARQALIRHRLMQLDDKIWRAWGLLSHARVLSSEETLAMLSHLRLGVNLGRIETVDLRTLNELILLTLPAHLQKLAGKPMGPGARREARADLVRRRLGRQ